MEKRTLEKDMTIAQQLGMVTFKNVIRALIDNSIDFQVFTRELDGYIVKEIGRLPFYFRDDNNVIDIDTISFRFFENSETLIYIYPDDERDLIEEYDCFKGFNVILNLIYQYSTVISRAQMDEEEEKEIKEREAV